MKFTLGWLKDHLDTTASLQEISDALTAGGLEVEQIVDRSETLAPFTVAKILHAEKHPDADKLRVCKVQADSGELQIVCGAPNAREGIHVALAKEGCVIPTNGMKIKKSKIRGVESCGMLCSADELGIGEDSDGIMELPKAEIGTPIANVLGLNDPMIEIAITPNRADALGVRGIARDLAATGLGALKPLPDVSDAAGKDASPISISIETDACKQFVGCTIQGVKNTPSPAWMQSRLTAIGQRPISALVDITNYITFDLGRPLHVYDVAKLNGNMQVRAAKAGEKIKALNDKEYNLKEGMCVIADDNAPTAIGGIIGGLDTGCTDDTTDVFLEVALFAPIHVTQTGRELQIDSDARYRFERGVDVAFLEQGALHAIRLITELCGGQPSALVQAGEIPHYKRDIPFKSKKVDTLGGVKIEEDKAYQILEALGFSVNRQESTITPPSWRADIEGEADLIEEVLRIVGYDAIPATPLPKLPQISKPSLAHAQKQVHLSKRILATRGMLECCTWSFMAEKNAATFGGVKDALKLRNPISADLNVMRPNLLPNLLEAAKNNSFRGATSLSLFELGLQYHNIMPDGQAMVAAGIRAGKHPEYQYVEQFQRTQQVPGAYTAKADALALLDALGVTKYEISTNTPTWYHPGRSGALMLGKNIIGYFGELHPRLAKAYDLDTTPVAAFEIFLDALPQSRKKVKTKPALQTSEYQLVQRDFAFVVDKNVTAAEMIKTLSKADKKLITDVQIFDVYAGKGVEDGKKSVALQVTLQPIDRTLTDDEIGAVSKAITNAAQQGFGGILRQ